MALSFAFYRINVFAMQTCTQGGVSKWNAPVVTSQCTHQVCICKIPNTYVLFSPQRNLRLPTASTCSLCWTTVAGNNSFSKTNVYAVCFVQWCRAHFVKCWFCGPDKDAFYDYVDAIYTQYTYNKGLYTYMNVCICTHTGSRWTSCGVQGLVASCNRTHDGIQHFVMH
jgi:hypothetical protein